MTGERKPIKLEIPYSPIMRASGYFALSFAVSRMSASMRRNTCRIALTKYDSERAALVPPIMFVVVMRSFIKPNIRKVMAVKSRFPRTARRIPANRSRILHTISETAKVDMAASVIGIKNEVQTTKVDRANTKKPAADR